MIRFECDYTEGACPEIMQRLCDTNMEQTSAYSTDEHSNHARALIRGLCGRPDAEVHFLVGGTQTNLTVIAAALRPYQGVLTVQTGHINVHETGAIEACGHKVLTVPSEDGRISAEQIRAVCDAHRRDHNHEHMVQPGMVYISQPTENGTLYTRAQLTAIHEACRDCGVLLYVDGARLGYGLAAEGNDVTIPDLAALTDAFYIGGTKVGLLFGEALVLLAPALQTDFRYLIKQRGGLLAKGRLLGVQFETVFEDGLYFRISAHAVAQAMRIRRAFEALGVQMLFDSRTNQQYPILPQQAYDRLARKYAFEFWCKPDEAHTAVRFCTSWATRDADVDALIADLPAALAE